jgi:hypothetical protein
MRKYCRICWNTSYWREPTGDASRLEFGKSYVRRNGFGHEEWLFNFSWLQAGPIGSPTKFKYGFLQPIGKYRDTYEGRTFDVLAYTVTPERVKVAVAIIRNLYVPRTSELNNAVKVMRRNGWLKQMENDLLALCIQNPKINRLDPASHLINVRFDPSDVAYFDPRIAVPDSHKLYRIDRYQPIDWEDDFPENVKNVRSKSLPIKDGVRRAEHERKRTAVAGTTYSPQHVRLQNALYDHLCKLHGKKGVGYERANVDLTLNENGKTTYFEIKIAPTAKSCIREALGQLLKYAHYPDQSRAERLIVVGDGEPTLGDMAYLRYIRTSFKLPVYYRCWEWKSGTLGAES